MAYGEKSGDKLKRQIIYREAIKAHSLIDMVDDNCVKVESTPKPQDQNHTILKGRINNLECHSNLKVHATDIIEVRDHEVKSFRQPAVTCSLILNGKAEGTIGGKFFSLDGSNQPMGYIWAMNKAMLWTRTIKKDSHVRKVTITVEREWLLQEISINPDDGLSNFLAGLLEGPISIQKWLPSKRALSLAEQLLQPSKSSAFIQKIHMESRALEILCEALESMTSVEAKPEQVSTSDKAQQIRSYIENNVSATLSLNLIAKSLGMAVNTMQRLFKKSYGMTVMDYLRERRLEIAKEAMERDDLTITQAAFKAGYNSPANFATAFKKTYGFTPSSMKH